MRTSLLKMAPLWAALLCWGAACGGEDPQSPAPTPDMGMEDMALEDMAHQDQGDLPSEDTGADVVDEEEIGEDVGPDGIEDMGPDMEDMGEEPFPGWEAVEPVPMMWVDGLALIQAHVASTEDEALPIDRPMPYVMDTLSQTFFADVDVVGDPLFHEVDITVGNRDLGRLAVKGRSMEPDEAYLGLDIGGLVGHLYFNNRFTVFDYPNQQFYLVDQAPPPELPPPGYEDAPRAEALYDLPNIIPVVTTVIGEAGETVLLADTSSRMTFVTQRVFDAIDDGTLPQVGGYRFQTNFGEDPGFLTRLPSLQLGGAVVEDLEAVVIPDENHLVGVLRANGVEMEGYLGAGFWSRFALGLDGHIFSQESGSEGGLKKLIFWGDGQRPEAWEGRWTRVGVVLTWRQGQIQAEMVLEGSSAQEAGLVPGTRITAIDGVSTQEMPLEEARSLLRGEVGQTRSLEIWLPEAEAATLVEVAIEEFLP